MAKDTKGAKPTTDWDAVEPHFRAGIRTLEDIGKEFGVSKGRISQVAKEKGWVRDLNGKIRAQADAKLQRQAAEEKLNAEVLNDPAKQARRRLVESQVVEANVDMQVAVRMEHRTIITRTRKLFISLLQELEVASTPEGTDLIETMFDIVHGSADSLESDPDDKQGQKRAERLRQLLDRALSTSGRITSAKVLTEMLEKLIKLERQAHGIDEEDKGDNDLDRLLKKIHGERAGS